MRDLMSDIHVLPALAPAAAAITDNTAQVGAVIDRLGYDSVTFAIVTGTLADADATFAVTVEHGDVANLSDAAAVPAASLVGTTALAGFTFADDAETRKIGYVGEKRYVRLTITPSSNTGNAPMAAIAILGHPAQAPTPNPPV
ncbi:hypothetical protein EOD42_03020 [Rhodovarius crocodyli]|uniref:Uncharacterized protein n=1 Tax=Rhodovarius crocodyli TaxID=1979269 RepID=A0A437MN72_9PROT|nr:hypothetical protein [Rhodovarius crocodyli]RVT99093.1 hypothetical protein EOD42_03020 [Rhodovarius crocodyli]